MTEDWLTSSASQGELGLRCLNILTRTMYLCRLRDEIRVCATLSTPWWLLSALQSMPKEVQDHDY